MVISTSEGGENILFNDALYTFCIPLYDVVNMVNDYTDTKRGNLLPSLHGLLFPISRKGYFICTNPQIG